MRVLQIHSHYRQAGGADAVVDKERQALLARDHEAFSIERQNLSQRLRHAAQIAGFAFKLPPYTAFLAAARGERSKRTLSIVTIPSSGSLPECCQGRAGLGYRPR
jgi:hypothetical protein